jgi:phospholipid/cholesterol/gamma-HCH transport system substrate-binding protein
MKTRQAEERKHEIKVGLTILMALIVLTFAILSVSQQKGLFQDKYQLKVLLARVNGLQTGAPVQLAGVKVGAIVKIQFSDDIQDQKIEVVMEIERQAQSRIRSDSEAHIGTLGLLGDKFVGITLGSVDQPILKHGDFVRGADPVDLDRILDESAGIFEQLKNATKSIEEIAYKINASQGTLGLLVNDPRIYFDLDKLLMLMEDLTTKINSGQGTLARVLQDSSLYINLNQTLKTTLAIMDSVRSGHGTAGKFLTDPIIFDELAQSTTRLNEMVQRVNTGQGTLGQVMNNEKLYLDLIRVTAEMDSLIKDIRRNPQRYLKVEIF